MSINQLTASIKTALTAQLGVASWDNIGFSLLPADSPLGYLQLTNVPASFNQSIITLEYMVMIGFAANSLGDIQTAVHNMVQSILATYNQPSACLGSNGQLQLDSQIAIDTPDSDSTQNNITNTNLFRNAIAFKLKVLASKSILNE